MGSVPHILWLAPIRRSGRDCRRVRDCYDGFLALPMVGSANQSADALQQSEVDSLLTFHCSVDNDDLYCELLRRKAVLGGNIKHEYLINEDED
jgi:hypothetical protein